MHKERENDWKWNEYQDKGKMKMEYPATEAYQEKVIRHLERISKAVFTE